MHSGGDSLASMDIPLFLSIYHVRGGGKGGVFSYHINYSNQLIRVGGPPFFFFFSGGLHINNNT